MLKDFTKLPMDVIIVAGQSNAEGSGLGAVPEPYIPKPEVWSLHRDFTISQAVERIKGNDVRGRFSLKFADCYLASGYLKGQRNLLMVNAATGGTGFAKHQWGEGEPLSERLYEMTETALSLNRENRIVAFLWHQGEHDANFETPPQLFASKLSNLFSTFIRKFGEDYPMIAGDFVPMWKEEKGMSAQAIASCIQDVMHSLNHGYYVTTEGLTSNCEEVEENHETVHFSRKATQILGERYFNKFLEYRQQSEKM